MISYVKVELQIHGINRNEPRNKQSLDHILRRIECSLRREFSTQFDSDVEVTLEESAGEEPNAADEN